MMRFRLAEERIPGSVVSVNVRSDCYDHGDMIGHFLFFVMLFFCVVLFRQEENLYAKKKTIDLAFPKEQL